MTRIGFGILLGFSLLAACQWSDMLVASRLCRPNRRLVTRAPDLSVRRSWHEPSEVFALRQAKDSRPAIPGARDGGDGRGRRFRFTRAEERRAGIAGGARLGTGPKRLPTRRG